MKIERGRRGNLIRFGSVERAKCRRGSFSMTIRSLACSLGHDSTGGGSVVTEPWRVAVVGPEFFLDANRRVYSRLKVLRADWPRVTFHIITETTGAVAGAAIRAAKKLKMEYAAVGDPLSRAERVICWWDFAHKPTGDLIFRALQQKLPTEVYNRENEPAGPEAADEVIGWTL